MAKAKTVFFCQHCGAQSSKWMGRCPSCGEWNTYVEEVVQREESRLTDRPGFGTSAALPHLIHEVSSSGEKRIVTSDQEFNRVLGGGLMAGSLVLGGGEPGIGKSTLMLQVALHVRDMKVLYITGEESEQQIRVRADRLGIRNQHCYILAETLTRNILQHLEEVKPGLVVVDSIQTLQTDILDSSAGSISQIRECASELQKYAKLTSVPVILIGHITKDGTLAGPKLLEHMVDTVLQFEGDRNYGFRILRSVKNRFGPTSELGIYEMLGSGLREVANPSEILISQREENMSGMAIASTMEGLRPMLIEIQALVSSAVYGTPQRSTTGFDARRLNMLLAVLEKRSGFRLGFKDVFLNIAGGIRVDDPALDLAVVTAILSSNEDIPVSKSFCFAAEVGLSGEIRPVNYIAQRVAEANKLGFEKIFLSRYNLKGLEKKNLRLEIQPIAKISELYSLLFT